MSQPFDHRAHVLLTWEALGRVGLAGALIEVPAYLRGLATAAGHPEKFHHTLTLGFLLLIADRWEPGETFAAFSERNPDLFRHPGALDRYWRPETLASDRARSRFVFPDQMFKDG